MNDKGTPTETSTHIPLTSVDSRKVCKLGGVSETRRGKGRHGKQRGWFKGSGKHDSKHKGQPERHKEDQQYGHRRRITKRLLDLGLTKGCDFRVIQSRGSGPVLVEVRGTRIALGHGLASQVMVEVLEDST
ncbi:MAG: FeoA family protein [Candidatus Thorarchaeota archaeon]